MSGPARAAARRRGFSAVELLVVMLMATALVVVLSPRVLASRENTMRTACRETAAAIEREVRDQLELGVASAGAARAESAVNATVHLHAASPNPRTPHETAVVGIGSCGPFVPTPSTGCQVFLCHDGSDMILGSQHDAGTTRSFRVSLD